MALYFVPLWRITLEAPQYPSGISMYIWINQITGDTEFTIQNINILNHYVGMKYIEPDSIPELKYFPIVVAVLVLFGLVAAWSSSRILKLSWVIVLFICAGLGIYDFYLWEYDYGHNLSPTAPIKVPGMSYQPPLIGTKMLLNFKAMSYPHWGGLALAISMTIGLLSVWVGRKSKKVNKVVGKPLIVLILALSFLTTCSSSPQPLGYGEDACHYCKMILVDTRFGAEWISSKGKIYKFDAVECMLDYLQKDKGATGSSWITSFEPPNQLAPAEECRFLVSKELPSPMGLYLTGYKNHSLALSYQSEFGGDLYNWNQIQKSFSQLKEGI